MNERSPVAFRSAPPEIPAGRHYVRLLVILGLAAVAFAGVRAAVVPASMGRDGHYRGAAVDEIVAREPRYLGVFTCTECHAAGVAAFAETPHAKVSCETCHGPAKGHLTTASGRVKLAVERGRELCLGCHAKLVGRPASHPQIEVAVHQEENDFKPDDKCVDCHEMGCNEKPAAGEGGSEEAGAGKADEAAKAAKADEAGKAEGAPKAPEAAKAGGSTP